MGLLTILYQDADLVAIDKPDGLMVHRSRLSGDQVFALQILRDQIGRFVYPVHRLDRPTSGVLLFALSPETASKLCDDFAAGRVVKDYLAVVRGIPDEHGTIDSPIHDTESGVTQPAETRYRRLATADLGIPIPPRSRACYSLLQVTPVTGRMHQIRRHLKHIRHPVVGDTQHGDGHHNRFVREQFGIQRLLLQCRSLSCRHPASGQPLTLRAALPSDWQNLFHHLGWRAPDLDTP
jgi:tRNA pseudouridine65 synthase